MTRPEWKQVESQLTLWDGAATEIFVIDIPADQLPFIIEVLSAQPTLEVLEVDGVSLDPPAEFDTHWHDQVLESAYETPVALRSGKETDRHLQIYLWISESKKAVDVEFVFWNDMTFPAGISSEVLSTRFDRLVNLAEACRSGAPEARCILSDEHNGDPRELLLRPDILVW